VDKEQLKVTAKQALPESFYKWARTQWNTYQHTPPLGKVNLGHLRRTAPISREWHGRGLAIDRYYIQNFMERQSHDIGGRVLEIGDNSYTREYGGDRVTKSDVLNVGEGSPDTTIIGDLADAPQIPDDSFDCFIATQVLQYLYDVPSAVKTIYRILKPGGVALITLPNLTPLIDPYWNDCWYWGFTSVSAQRLFEEFFAPANVQVETYGNVLAATAFLHGLGTQELKKEELDYCDPSFQVLITVRAVKHQENP
jgi:SAM-dependent methyltransferase